MLHRHLLTLCCCLALVSAASAQTQIATVTSNSPFQLRGVTVTPGQGVPSWPVMPGDTIQAGKTPLTVTFQDGSTIVLAPQTSAKVELVNGTPKFHLLACGPAHYVLKSLASLTLEQGDVTVTPKEVTGDLLAPCAIPGWWTTAHTVGVVAGAAGAAGLAVAVSQARSVSPIK